jgi:hypothetical protein
VVDPPSTGAPLGTEVWTAVGSYGEARMRVADVQPLGEASRARVVTALSASRADDDFTYLDPTASTPGHDVYAKRINANHAAVDGLASLALPVAFGRGREGTLTITALLQARRQQVPGTVLEPTPYQRFDSDRELASVAVTIPGACAAKDEWDVRAWGRRDELALNNPLSTPALGPTQTSDAIVASGGAASWRGDFGRASVTAQVDGSEERYIPGTWLGGTAPAGSARASLGGALDGEWRATQIWSWEATARADGWSDTSDDPSLTPHSELRPTGHLGTQVRVGPVTLLAHGGAVARPPSFVELFGDRGEFIGNPSLRPESAWTIDAGGRVASKRSAPLRGRAEVALFGTWANDLIVFVPQGAYGQALATNIGSARILGIEAEAAASALGFELRVAYTGMTTENDSQCAATAGTLAPTTGCARPPLPGRPANDLVADLTYTLGTVRARWGLDAVTGMIADQVGTVLVPARVLNSAGLRFDVPGVRGLRLAVDVRNVFDERTTTYDGPLGPVHEPIGDAYEYPIPGRTFLASVRWATGE